MKNHKFNTVLLSLVVYGATIFFCVTKSYGQVINGTGSYSGSPGFDRGFQATTYCGNSPESWVRGSAFLEKSTGLLTMWIGLETDATDRGPKGQILVYVYDCNGNLLSKVASAEVGIGGKMPGGARINNFQSYANLGPQIGSQACSITVVANCTGSTFQLFGLSMDQVTDAAGLIVQFGTYFF